jgi:type VII secretion-associated serine protease mycosin
MLRRTALVCLAVSCLLWLPAASARADSIRDSQQWVLAMMDVSSAWQVTQGRGVTVAVVDSGVNSKVSDLIGRVSTGPDFTGVSTSESNPDWGVHGTWMASLIAGHGHGDGDDAGVLGIAPKAHVLSVRVIPDHADPAYGSYEHEPETRIQDSLAAGINYAVTSGARVISMSIGYSSPSTVVRQALLNAFRRGVVVVASAGNSGTYRDGQAPESFPADYPGVISVGAVNASGRVAGFSSDNLSVQVAAPGVNVPAQGRDGQYWYVSGTSPACALVAGVAALIKARYPDLAPELVAKALTSTTTGQPAGGYDSKVGFGIVNAAAALAKAGRLTHSAPRPPGVPAAAHFGGGPAAVPAAPVRPRGTGQLILFAILALTSLVLTGAAATRLAILRRTTSSRSYGPPPPYGPSGPYGPPPPYGPPGQVHDSGSRQLHDPGSWQAHE